MSSLPIVKVRENPAKRREAIGQITREMSLTVIKFSPEDKRGVLFGKIVAAGIKALRPELTTDMSGMVIETAAANVYRSVREIMKALDSGVLKERVAELESQIAGIALPLVVDPKTLSKMRTLRECGMSYRDIGSVYGKTAEEIKGILTGRWRAGLKASKPAKLPQVTYQPLAAE